MDDSAASAAPDWRELFLRLERRVEALSAEVLDLRSALLRAREFDGDAEMAAADGPPGVSAPATRAPAGPEVSAVAAVEVADAIAAADGSRLEGAYAAAWVPPAVASDAVGASLRPGAAEVAADDPAAVPPEEVEWEEAAVGNAAVDARSETDDEDARRELVRREVEAARAELGLLRPEPPSTLFERWAQAEGQRADPAAYPPGDGETPSTIAPLAGPATVDHEGHETYAVLAEAERWQATHAEIVPPSIVIEDEVGRVELVRVYDTLSRIGCAEQAALLNYSPHSVTVGLHTRLGPVPLDELADAVRASFGRECEVTTDGVRIGVRLGDRGPGPARW